MNEEFFARYERERQSRPLPAADDPEQPIIEIQLGNIDKAADQAESALLASGTPIYQRGAMLVRPITQEVRASKGRKTLSAAFSPVTIPNLIDRLSQIAIFKRYDGKLKDLKRVDPPKLLTEVMLSRVGAWTFPTVAGIITTPTMRPDGSILTAPGYDPETRLYHAADASLTLTIPAQPSREQAEAALAELQYLLSGFPFITPTDASVALSGLLTPLMRGALPVVPMHCFRSFTPGSGKSFMVDVCAALATARPCPVASVSSDGNENDKRLHGLLLAGFPIINLDNVNGELGGDTLAQAIERQTVQIRALGGSGITEVETAASIFATGNNLRVRGDMVRRVVIGDLDPGEERPELRTFEFDPVEILLANRSHYLTAAFTIVVAHTLAGFPGAANLPPLASFGEWSKFVRGALVWLGCPDPCASIEAARQDDPELADLGELLAAWEKDIGFIDAITAADLVHMATARAYDDPDSEWKHPLIREIVNRLGTQRGALDSRKLGFYLRSKAGRILDRLRIARKGTAHGNTIRWRLEKT